MLWTTLALGALACGDRKKPISTTKSQLDSHKQGVETDADVHGPDQNQGAKDVMVADAISDATDSGATVLDGAVPDNAVPDGATPGDVDQVKDADASDGAPSDGDSVDEGPNVYTDDVLPPVSKVCDDGIGPGPNVGSLCTALGERRCVNLKQKTLKTPGFATGIPYQQFFCGRPYFVECSKNAQGELVWQLPQTCAGPGISPKSTNPKLSCNALPSQIYQQICRPGGFGSAHFCCPRIIGANHCGHKDYGRAVCMPNAAAYYVCLSYNQLTPKMQAHLNPDTAKHLQACSGAANDCVYWLNIMSTPQERLWCIDPTKKPKKDQWGQFIPPTGEYLYPHCIQVTDTKVRFAKTCKESGYWDAPGGP